MSTQPNLEVVAVERIDGTDVIVEFSDATTATYSAQELADLNQSARRTPLANNADRIGSNLV